MDQHRDRPSESTRREGVSSDRGVLGADGADGGHLVLHAENVDVHTENVATGRVTLRKRVVTEEVSVPVTLRHEELDVVEEGFDDTTAPAAAQGKTPAAPAAAGDLGEAGRRAAAAPRADLRHLDDGDVEITLYAERPVVRVEVVPVERVRVRRGVVTETKEVTVDVAHEEAYVDHEGTLEKDRTDRA